MVQDFVFSRAEDAPEETDMPVAHFDAPEIAVIAAEMGIDRLKRFWSNGGKVEEEDGPCWAVAQVLKSDHLG
jgi:hypothetical protein